MSVPSVHHEEIDKRDVLWDLINRCPRNTVQDIYKKEEYDRPGKLRVPAGFRVLFVRFDHLVETRSMLSSKAFRVRFMGMVFRLDCESFCVMECELMAAVCSCS